MNIEKRHPRTRGVATTILALALVAGCGGGADTTDVSGGADAASPSTRSTDSASDGASDSGEGSSPDLYVLTSNVWGDDGATGYLYTVRSLASGTATLENAVEFPGGAWLYGRDGDRFVYVSSGESGPIISRWEVTEDGRLREGPAISFTNLGLTQAPRFGSAQILSDTKAYVVDSTQHLVATWNPRDMEVGPVIELEIEDRNGLPGWIPQPVLRNDTLLLTVVWEEDWKYGEASRLIAIDTTTDRVVETRDDARCEQLAIGSLDSEGTAYYSPYAHSSAARSVLGSEYGTRSCGLRIVPSGVIPDEGWEVDLSALAGGRPAGEFVLASDEVGFFRAYYADEIGVTRETWQDSQSVPAFRWWRWEIGAPQAEEIPNQELTVEAAHYVVDGKTYVGNPSADWAATTIIEIDPNGALRDGLTVTGTPGGLVKVR
jgi:hypothetical protein